MEEIPYAKAVAEIAAQMPKQAPEGELYTTLLGARALLQAGIRNFRMFSALEVNHHFLVLSRRSRFHERLVVGRPERPRTVRIGQPAHGAASASPFVQLYTDNSEYRTLDRDDPLVAPISTTVISGREFAVHEPQPVEAITDPEALLSIYAVKAYKERPRQAV